MAAVVFVGGRWLTKEDPRPPTKTSRHETTTNGKPGSAAQKNSFNIKKYHRVYVKPKNFTQPSKPFSATYAPQNAR